MIALQKDFSGGIDLVSSDTQIADNAYLWLVNARQRFGTVDPIKKHVLQEDVPAGLKQGIISVGNILIAFVSGFAYYKEIGTSNPWVQLANFLMASTVKQYYTEAVPASTFNFVRKANENLKAPITVTTNFKVAGTPQCVVVQDGVNQPWIIIYDDVNQQFSARETKRYVDWQNLSTTADDREYVPIGKQMLYTDGILFIVAKDGKSIYRSVTGRPLDFMVNVDPDGNKMPTESEGGAATVSFAFDFDYITCIAPSNTPSSFILATAKTTRIVSMDFNNTIFDEPTFTALPINIGIVNQFSIVEVLGDFAVVDYEGVKGFNAVLQLKFRGRNTNFSLQMSKLIKGIKQTSSACVNFNNYCLFNITTVYGNVIAVYDNLINKWVAFDVTEISNVKQFVVVETDTESRLFCITEQDELWEMFAGTTTYVPMVRTKSYIATEADVEHKGQFLRAVFSHSTYDGTATVMELVDEAESSQNRETKDLKIANNGIRYAVRPPVMPSTDQRVDNPTFSMSQGLTGKKISYIISWTNDAKLVEFKIQTSEMKSMVAQKFQQQTYSQTYGTNS